MARRQDRRGGAKSPNTSFNAQRFGSIPPKRDVGFAPQNLLTR